MADRAPGRTAAILALVAATLLPAPDTRSAVAYVTLGALACWLAGAAAAATPLGPPLVRRLQAVAAGARDRVLRLPTGPFVAAIAGVSLAAAALTSVLVFERTPAIIDGALYLFEAKVLAAGRWFAPAPALPEFFDVERMLVEGERWYSVYPPGFPLVLALGTLAGLPWLVNPVLAAAHAALVYLLARRIGSEGEARLAAVIAGLSPFVLLMSADFTSHPTSLVTATLFMWAVMVGVERRSPAAWALAGAAGGLCFAARPYTAASVCGVFALVGLVAIVRGRDLRCAAAGVAGAALPLGFAVLYNLATTGDAFLFGYAKLYGGGHLPGFGSTIWGEHTPLRGALHTLTNLNALNKDLLQLPLPALLLPALLFLFGRPGRWDRYLLLSFVALVAFHFFYGYQSLYLGPKFLYDGVGILAILSARGVSAGLRSAPRLPPGRLRNGLILAGALGVVVALPATVGARFWAVRQGYSDPAVVRAVERLPDAHALVFVPYSHVSRFAAGFARNTPTLDGRVVYARDRGPDNARLALRHPERASYRWHDGRLLPEPFGAADPPP